MAVVDWTTSRGRFIVAESDDMGSISRIKIEAAAASDRGVERSINQDVVYQWVSEQDLNPPRALLMVADGMGGHQEGEVASRLAVETINNILLPELRKKRIDKNKITEIIRTAVNESNASIFDYAIENDIIPQDMGTTLDCVVLVGIEAYLAHVGDGRVYILDRDGLRQITSDHSAVAEMVGVGLLDPEEIYTHPKRNILTQGLGGDSKLEVIVEKFDVSIGERILVCSDGLWGLVRDPAIEKILLWASPPHVLVKELIAAANEAGGEDNISIIICDILPA